MDTTNDLISGSPKTHYHLRLTYQELGRLRLLLDSDYRRILQDSPEALDDPQTYASAISGIRDQAIYLLDKHMERELEDA